MIIRATGLASILFAIASCGAHRTAQPMEQLGAAQLAAVPHWAATEHFANSAAAVAGAKLFAVSGCLNCHTYLRVGSRNLGAPDLSDEGAKARGIRFQVAHLKCPSCVVSGSPMPSFSGLGAVNLRKLAVFLEASKGG